MKKIVIGVPLLALMAPAAYAQQPVAPAAPAMAAETEPAEFLVFFDLDEATLNPEARQAVAEAAEAYRTTGVARVTVIGHTDTSGSAAYNLALSERRAEAVLTSLTTHLGASARALRAVGYGASRPREPNATIEGRARNRRVELVRDCLGTPK